MPNLVNRLVVAELDHEFKDANGMLIVSFGGLTVKETESLRRQMTEKGVKFRMVRNSLARLALKNRGLEVGDDVLQGNTGIAYGTAESAIHAAKAFTAPDVVKAGKVKVRAGMLDGKVLGARDALSLAGVPDKKTLQAKILGCVSGPPRALVCTLNAVPAGLVRVLQARADKLGEAGGPEATT